MNVNGISSVSAAASSAGTARPSAARTTDEATAATANEQQIDKTTGQPVAPRFPWLSRITAQLEKASNRGSPYGSAPLIGENVDKAA